MRTDALRIFALLSVLVLLAIACDVMDNIDSTLPDADNDTFPDVIDVDDDNDGLIDIDNLDMLYHMHYNLAGTTYDDEEADSGDGDAGSFAGAPTEATDNCDTATDGVYLCGYELTRDLDFAVAADYASNEINTEWRPNAANPDDDDNTGWPGIGGTTVGDPAFAARFEGNDNTISNLYMRRDSDNYIGLFNVTAESAHIRAVTITDATLYGTDATTHIGMLVGLNNGQITESSASGAITGDSNRTEVGLGGLVGENSGEITRCSADATLTGEGTSGIIHAGGLVGINSGATSASSATGQISITVTVTNATIPSRGGGLVGTNTGSIIDSYATGAVNTQIGAGLIGGLVGRNGDAASGENFSGSIIASYATGAVTGGGGDDAVGGLVGENAPRSDVIASYTTGNVSGEGGRDRVGGLVGVNNGIAIIASYATGVADGGGGGSDNVGGLVGANTSTQIIASYATGSARGGEGAGDIVGGLVGLNSSEGTILASYATEDADGEIPGRLVGFNANTVDPNAITESYGFGMPTPDPDTQTVTAITLTSDNAGTAWNNATNDTLNAWDFGNDSQPPALRYADYDDAGTDYECAMFPDTIPDTIPGTTIDIECGTTLLPGQRE